MCVHTDTYTHITTQLFSRVTNHPDLSRAIESLPRLLGHKSEGKLNTQLQRFKKDFPILALEGTIAVLTTGTQGLWGLRDHGDSGITGTQGSRGLRDQAHALPLNL